MLETAINNLSDEINYRVEVAINEAIKDYIPTLADYLDYLDSAEKQIIDCSENVEIRFENHRVFAKIRPNGEDVSYTELFEWKYVSPKLTDAIEIECEGLFESMLNKR